MPGQPGLYRETLSEKTITKRKPKNKNPMCLHDQNSIVNSTRRIICLKHKSGVGTSWPWKHIHTHTHTRRIHLQAATSSPMGERDMK